MYIIYSARSSTDGRAATSLPAVLLMQVRVIDPCAPGQITCLESRKCSVLNKVCDLGEVLDQLEPRVAAIFSEGGGSSSSAPELSEPFVPEPDTTPPVLHFVGTCEAPSCEPALTPSGTRVRVYRLEVGQELFISDDPGDAYVLVGPARIIGCIAKAALSCVQTQKCRDGWEPPDLIMPATSLGDFQASKQRMTQTETSRARFLSRTSRRACPPRPRPWRASRSLSCTL